MGTGGCRQRKTFLLQSYFVLISPIGQNLRPEEGSRLAVISAIKYHRDHKDGNSTVSICFALIYSHVLKCSSLR